MNRATGLAFAVLVACGDAANVADPASPCGADYATVVRVLDGDTLELRDGRHVRVIGVDAPELHSSKSPECYASEAATYLRELVEGREIALTYDDQGCEDRYGRTLAHVESSDGDVAELLVTRGLACAYFVPPIGADRRAEIAGYEFEARARRRGLWYTCAADLPDCAR